MTWAVTISIPSARCSIQLSYGRLPGLWAIRGGARSRRSLRLDRPLETGPQADHHLVEILLPVEDPGGRVLAGPLVEQFQEGRPAADLEAGPEAGFGLDRLRELSHPVQSLHPDEGPEAPGQDVELQADARGGPGRRDGPGLRVSERDRRPEMKPR